MKSLKEIKSLLKELNARSPRLVLGESPLETLDTWLSAINKAQLLFTTTGKRDREKIYLPQALFETGNLEAIHIFLRHVEEKTWSHQIDTSSFPFPTGEWPEETQVEGLKAWKSFCGNDWKKHILPLWKDILSSENQLVEHEITAPNFHILLENYQLEKVIVLLMQTPTQEANKKTLQTRIEEQKANIQRKGFQVLPHFEAFLYTSLFCTTQKTEKPLHHGPKVYAITTNHAAISVQHSLQDWTKWISISRPNALQKLSVLLKSFETKDY